MATTKQKKKVRRPRKPSRLPKAVEALLSYLGPPTMGAPTIQQTGQRFASMGGTVEPSKGFATQVAEAVVARQAAAKAARLAAGAEPLKKSLVSTILPPQLQQPTIIVQQPAAAVAEPSRTQTEDIRKEVMKETGGIERRLTSQLREQGYNQLAEITREIKAQKYDVGSLPSEMIRSFGRQSAPSFSSYPFRQDVAEADIESLAGSSSASAANFPTVSPQEAAAFQAAQHSQSLATAKLPPAQKLRGRAPAAPKEPKEPKPRGRPKKAAAAPPAPTFSQAVGGLAAVAQAQTPRSVSSAASAGSSKSRAREIYESASRKGLSGGDLVYAMAQGGGAAPEPQQVGRSLGELSTRRTKRGMKVVGFNVAESSVEV
jgi:hypothetical protein